MDAKVSGGVNISSVILGVSPEGTDQVRKQLLALKGVEVHAVADDGRMIVSIESAAEDDTVGTFEAIRQTPGVLSASLVYHHYETEPDEEA